MMKSIKKVQEREESRNEMVKLMMSEDGGLGKDSRILKMIEKKHFRERQLDRAKLNEKQEMYKKQLLELNNTQLQL